MIQSKSKHQVAKRSPLKTPPAPLPGQSSDERLQLLLEDKGLLWAMMAVLPAVFALLEWGRWLFSVPPQPIGLTVLAVVVSAVAFRRLLKLRQEVARLRLGIEGERWVGQFLEALRGRGYLVFHDITEDGFNIDHALIGPAGVFSIETKTVRKSKQRQPTITYDGDAILVDDLAPSRDPVVQAKAAANHLRQILEQSTGMKRLPVRPVVLYPGWFVEKQPRGVAVWVLNPQALPVFLDYEDQVLTDDEISKLGFHLAQYVKLRRPSSV